jgi:hypothetical protein
MRRFLLTAAAFAFAAVPALAGGPQCRWAKSWDEAMAEAKARNVPIHVTFHKDG